jgi:hypothetical protein
MEQNNSFILVDGVLKWIQDMPFRPHSVLASGYTYDSLLQSAIASAVEVSNQEEVLDQLWRHDERINNPIPFLFWKENMFPYPKGKIYELNCRVETSERDIAQCCDCDKAIYKEDRFMRDDGNGFSTSVCPECEAESFYNLKEVTAHVTFEEQIEPATEETQESFDGFVVTIDDGFVAYEYKFPGGNHLSIHQIAEAISSGCGLEIESHKQVKESNP